MFSSCGCLRLHSTRPSATADLSAVPPSPAAPLGPAPLVRAAPALQVVTAQGLRRVGLARSSPAPGMQEDKPTAPSWLPSPSRHPAATQASPQLRLVVSAPVAATAARVGQCRIRASNLSGDRLPTLLVNAQMGKWIPLYSWPSHLKSSAIKRFRRILMHVLCTSSLHYPIRLCPCPSR